MADDDLFDVSWEQHRAISRLTAALAIAVLVIVGFAVGVLVQRSHDQGLIGTSSSVAGGAGGGTGAGGFGGGGAGGGGAAGGSGVPAAVPVVVGVIDSVTADTLKVKNFGGVVVTVKVPPSARVSTAGLARLSKGSTVFVTGTKAGDGTVTATTVVSRNAG